VRVASGALGFKRSPPRLKRTSGNALKKSAVNVSVLGSTFRRTSGIFSANGTIDTLLTGASTSAVTNFCFSGKVLLCTSRPSYLSLTAALVSGVLKPMATAFSAPFLTRSSVS